MVQEILSVEGRSPKKEDNTSSYGNCMDLPQSALVSLRTCLYRQMTCNMRSGDWLNESHSKQIMIVLQPLNIGDITNKIKTNEKRLKIPVNAP
jgi:hypothetical protein